MQCTGGSIRGYDRKTAGNELKPVIGIYVPNGNEVAVGFPLKVTLVSDTCELDTIVIVGALG